MRAGAVADAGAGRAAFAHLPRSGLPVGQVDDAGLPMRPRQNSQPPARHPCAPYHPLCLGFRAIFVGFRVYVCIYTRALLTSCIPPLWQSATGVSRDSQCGDNPGPWSAISQPLSHGQKRSPIAQVHFQQTLPHLKLQLTIKRHSAGSQGLVSARSLITPLLAGSSGVTVMRSVLLCCALSRNFCLHAWDSSEELWSVPPILFMFP